MLRTRTLAVALLLAGLFTAATAEARPPEKYYDHFQFSLVDDESCSFPVRQSYEIDTMFIDYFDAQGTMVRSMAVADVSLTYVNLSTGATFTEQYHQINHLDYLKGTWSFTGNWDRIRDEDGRLVLVLSGRFVFDLETGDILETTPHTAQDWNPTFCGAVGG